MEFSYTKSTDTGTNMVTKDYSKSRMRENCKYGSVRGGQSNLIPSTRLRGFRGEGSALSGAEYKGAAKLPRVQRVQKVQRVQRGWWRPVGRGI